MFDSSSVSGVLIVATPSVCSTVYVIVVPLAVAVKALTRPSAEPPPPLPPPHVPNASASPAVFPLTQLPATMLDGVSSRPVKALCPRPCAWSPRA